MSTRAWIADSLPSFERTIIALPAEDDGELVATLVRRSAEPDVSRPARAVLYLHGYLDYFFQTHVADAFAAAGWDFHALDLRRHGRSLRGGNRPNYVTDLAHYDTEISAALDTMRDEGGYTTVALLGHSTGGLIAAHYAAHGTRRDAVQALILNSPFFAFAVPGARKHLIPLAERLGAFVPMGFDPKGLAGHYGHSLLKAHRGEWEYDTRWKPITGFPIYWGWVRAIRRAQREVAQGLGLTIPVLVLHSARFADARGEWRDEFGSSDIVLDPADMRRVAPTLGRDVTVVEIAGGLHDLYLSAGPVRARALADTMQWLTRVSGAPIGTRARGDQSSANESPQAQRATT